MPRPSRADLLLPTPVPPSDSSIPLPVIYGLRGNRLATGVLVGSDGDLRLLVTTDIAQKPDTAPATAPAPRMSSRLRQKSQLASVKSGVTTRAEDGTAVPTGTTAEIAPSSGQSRWDAMTAKAKTRNGQAVSANGAQRANVDSAVPLALSPAWTEVIAKARVAQVDVGAIANPARPDWEAIHRLGEAKLREAQDMRSRGTATNTPKRAAGPQSGRKVKGAASALQNDMKAGESGNTNKGATAKPHKVDPKSGEAEGSRSTGTVKPTPKARPVPKPVPTRPVSVPAARAPSSQAPPPVPSPPSPPPPPPPPTRAATRKRKLDADNATAGPSTKRPRPPPLKGKARASLPNPEPQCRVVADLFIEAKVAANDMTVLCKGHYTKGQQSPVLWSWYERGGFLDLE